MKLAGRISPVAKYKVRWKVPPLKGDEWVYGSTVHGAIEDACADAEDVFGYEGVGPVQVYRDEGDAGVVEREWSRDQPA